MMEPQTVPEPGGDRVACEAVRAKAVDLSGQLRSAHHPAAIEAQRLAEGLLDAAAPALIGEGAADSRERALAPVDLDGFADFAALGLGVGLSVEAVPDHLPEERQKPRVAAVYVEQVGKTVDAFLEFVEHGGRNAQERFEVAGLVAFLV